MATPWPTVTHLFDRRPPADTVDFTVPLPYGATGYRIYRDGQKFPTVVRTNDLSYHFSSRSKYRRWKKGRKSVAATTVTLKNTSKGTTITMRADGSITIRKTP